MPTGNILVPDIGKKIAALLRRLKLKPQEAPAKFLERVGTSKHRYYTAARAGNGETVAFYARLHNNPDAHRKFLNEITVLGKLNGIAHRSAGAALVSVAAPRLFAHGREADFEWFTREYIAGNPLGHSRQLTAALAKGTITQLADAIASICRIPLRQVGLRLPSFNPQWYAIQKQCFGLAKFSTVSMLTCRGIARLVDRNRRLLSTENRYLAHGDLNLGNIIVEDGTVRIVDWELAQANNFAYDIGYLWVHLWQAPRMFRRQLMDGYLRHLDTGRLRRFKRLLPVVVAYLAIGGIPYRQNAHERKISQQRRRNYHVSLLQNCLKGFNRLIST